MDDTLYYILGSIITGGALICFIFSYYCDHREQHCRKRRSLYSIINRLPTPEATTDRPGKTQATKI